MGSKIDKFDVAFGVQIHAPLTALNESPGIQVGAGAAMLPALGEPHDTIVLPFASRPPTTHPASTFPVSVPL